MLLKLENIGEIYDSNDILTVGIRGIDLAFDYNEFVTIEGESGSGKSTLLNVIGANDTYEEGELYFNGEPTSHYSESDWEKYREKNIATIFQDFNIIENLTVLENVELALLRLDDKKERRRRAKELIARVGLTEQMNRRGSKLSGGEKQRTVMARALAKDAPIILADEPTGNLDVKASKEVAALLKEVSRDKLVIVVTHNPEFFKQYATRRVRIYDGSVSEDKQIEPPAPLSQTVCEVLPPVNRFHNLENAYKAADALIESELSSLRAEGGTLAERLSALEASHREADEALWAGIRQVQENLDALQQLLEGKDSALENKLNALIAEQEKTALAHKIVDIVLIIVVTALVVAVIVGAMKKKNSEK